MVDEFFAKKEAEAALADRTMEVGRNGSSSTFIESSNIINLYQPCSLMARWSRHRVMTLHLMSMCPTQFSKSLLLLCFGTHHTARLRQHHMTKARSTFPQRCLVLLWVWLWPYFPQKNDTRPFEFCDRHMFQKKQTPLPGHHRCQASTASDPVEAEDSDRGGWGWINGNHIRTLALYACRFTRKQEVDTPEESHPKLRRLEHLEDFATFKTNLSTRCVLSCARIYIYLTLLGPDTRMITCPHCQLRLQRQPTICWILLGVGGFTCARKFKTYLVTGCAGRTSGRYFGSGHSTCLQYNFP